MSTLDVRRSHKRQGAQRRVAYPAITAAFADRPRTCVLKKYGNRFGMCVDFARAVGMPHQAVCHWMVGDHLPRIETIAELAAHFGTTLDWLLLGLGPRDCPYLRRARISGKTP